MGGHKRLGSVERRGNVMIHRAMRERGAHDSYIELMNYVYRYIHIYIYTYIYIYIYTYIYMNAYIRMLSNVCICIYTHAHACDL
jgi:hypothetical protein